MADEEDGTTTGDNPPIELQQGPLVSVTFQKNPARIQKYLEAQPKELGITQIGLSIYQMTWVYAAFHEFEYIFRVPFTIAFIVVMIAGSLAIAAKALHIPTLRACLTMQILAIVSSVLTVFLMLREFDNSPLHFCWFYYHNQTTAENILCERMGASSAHAYSHLYVGGILVQLTLVAISVTLTVYCCKVINCCTPGSKMPVITVQAPPIPPNLE
ncbi:unnamed protein product [Lota lota]